jgi:raffinose/stachyose/melibiose transport system permease protein
MRSRGPGSVAAYAVSYGSTVLFLVPVYILINLAIRPVDDHSAAYLPSSRATLDNFIDAWTQSTLPSAFVTSVIVTVLSCLAVLVLSTMAAYPLARSTARLSTATFYFFLIGLLLPFQVALLPLYLVMRDVHLLGTIWSLVLFYTGVQMPFSIFLVTTFLRTSVPTDYEEAARIDGCGDLAVFRHVVVPLLLPVLGTLVILNAVGIWNDFFTPLLYLAGSNKTTIPVSIYSFVGVYSSNWPLIFASLIISMIPVLALYLIFQRYVIQGFAGGLKG